MSNFEHDNTLNNEYPMQIRKLSRSSLRYSKGSIKKARSINNSVAIKPFNLNDQDNKMTDTDNPKILNKDTKFDSVIVRKKTYFKNIKVKKEEKEKENIKKRRLEIITKLLLYVVSNIINILAVFNYIFQTYFDKVSDVSRALDKMEIAFSFYFVFEFIFIFTRIKVSWYKHLFTIDTIIDIITILPSLISFLLTTEKYSINFIRVFRLFRVFRILRIYKSLKMLQFDNIEGELGQVNGTVRLNPVKLQFFTIVVILFCLFFISSGLVIALQDLIENAFNKKSMNFFDAIYFMIITNVSVGYGDIIPTHPVSRFFVIFCLFVLIIVVSNQFTKLAHLLVIWGDGVVNYTGQNHIVLICDNTFYLYLYLQKFKSYDPDRDIVIISNKLKKLPSREFPYENVILLVTINFDMEIFERANTKEAESIFCIASKGLLECDSKEKVNEFLILKINRYYSQIPIYVQTLYSERSFTNSKKILLFKKIIPILRIKSLIISKTLINPGFATFIQNLLFNDNKSNAYNFDSFDMAMQNYILGCENKIVIRELPSVFIHKDFYQAVLLIYAKSINDYFTKIITETRDSNRPILLIGIYDTASKIYSKEKQIMIYPNNYVIKKGTLGIFITYDDNNYLDKILSYFNNENKNENIDFKQFNKKDTIGGNLHKSIDKIQEKKVNFEDESIPDIIPNKSKDSHEFEIDRKPSNFNITNFYNFKNENKEDILTLNKPEINNYTDYVKRSDKHKITKSNIIMGFNKKVMNENTNHNLNFFERLELDSLKELKERIDISADACYSQQQSNDIFEIYSEKLEHFIDNRIYDVERINLINILENHILIIGYQDNLAKLLKLIFYHFNNNKVCLLSNHLSYDLSICKLLKQFKDLIYIKGEAENPFHLINAGIQKAFHVVFLCEHIDSKTNEDMKKILSFRAIDYFFNCNVLLELWDHKSTKFIGYRPLERKSQIITDEFIHPLFMAGRLLYLSHIDKIISHSYFKEKEVDTWIKLLGLGFEHTSTTLGFNTIVTNKKDSGYPVIVTIDIPNEYIGREYYNLVNDLFSLEPPCLSLGIYIDDPAAYMNIKSVGRIRNSKSSINLQIMGSHKRVLKNMNAMDKIEQGYMNNLKILKEISHNDKVLLDYIDVKKIHLPIFITNPQPGFIMEAGNKIQILLHHTHKLDRNVKFNIVKNKKKSFFIIEKNNPKRDLTVSQENMYLYINMLKEKIDKKYDEAFRLLDNNI